MDILRPKDHAEEIAIFRHGMIGQLCARDLEHGDVVEALRALSMERVRPPGSLCTLLPSTLFDGRAIRLRDGVLGIPNHVKALRPPPAVPLRGSLDTAGDPQREGTTRSGGGSARTRAHHRRWHPPIHFFQVSSTYALLPSKNRIAEGLLSIKWRAR